MGSNIEESQDDVQVLKGKKGSSLKLRRHDSLDVEASRMPDAKKLVGLSVMLKLAFQSIGVVYGDIGTSPLYVFSSIFLGGIKHEEDVLGALSLILYTITLIPVVKYVFIVLQANDNGDGGTFALYSLICRYSKVGLIPSTMAEDKDVSTFKLDMPDRRTRRASQLKSMLEKSEFAKFFLLFATMLGTSMVIGDGVLTPCISVLSAIGGVKAAAPDVMTENRIVWLAVAILIVLFMFQRFGTEKVGYTFAPILCLWFVLIAGIGVYNFAIYDATIIRALNPMYIVAYFQRNGKEAWISLGGVVMCITGAEALFADVGHFSVRSIQVSMCFVTYPALILAYLGQAAYLTKHTEDVADTFYKSVPQSIYWPMFAVAVLAAIIASQALISGTFAIIQQSLALGCFPRVKIVHTSSKHHGQIYIPEINNLLMICCVLTTIGFKTTEKLGNAYGIAVVFVMFLTSCFLVLVMIMIWKTHILLIIAYCLCIVSVELLFLSSVLYKFDQGGYLPLAFAMFLMLIMYVWNYVYRKKYHYELENKISPEKVKETVDQMNSHHRLPGLAIFYSELVHGIPPIFKHYVENVPALHSVLVFASVKSLPISKVPLEERFLFRRVKPYDLYVFRCVVRYGYNDIRNEEEPFEKLLVARLKHFIKEDYMFSIQANGDDQGEAASLIEKDVELLERASNTGVVHLVGEQDIVAGKESGVAKRVVINYAYNFLKRNLRQSNKVFDIPTKRMLKVGMTCEL
ncbi:potassium transporter 5-like [Lycium ferocissimum]|uniref:potassium transporter 5-like n=1 Tax=Lycium ferocissimum TaxID=112874 RepID=UPI0028156BCE|nr:potassium transporter 5-like [Lycium ferocissimum]